VTVLAVPVGVDGLGDALTAVLLRVRGGDVEVQDLRRLSGGASMETWVFDVVGAEAPDRLVLRRDRAGVPQSSRLDEARLLTLVREHGVPAPKVVCSGEADEVGTSYLIMEHLDGETIPRRLLRDATFESARPRLVGQVAAALAGTHRVPARDATFLGPSKDAEAMVREYADVLRRLGDPSPALELAVRWLLRHLPAPVAPALVHGDCRTGNLMVDSSGLVAVLDWELAHTGDPREDLGWFCVRAWRFGNDDRQAGGFGTRRELLEAYAEAGGGEVDEAALRFWELFGTLKWGVVCMSQAAIYLRGDDPSMELAAIGRRVAETEYDVLNLLGEA